MATQTPATLKMVQNIIDGTTPVKNMLTTNTEQTVSGKKIFDNEKIFIKDSAGNSYSPYPYYETTETSANNLPRVNGHFHNGNSFTAGVPLTLSNFTFDIVQHVATKEANMPLFIYQEAYCMTARFIRKATGGIWTEWSQTGLIATGDSKKPVYINASGIPAVIDYTLGDACAKAVSDSINPSSLSSADVNVPTVRDIFFALPTINDNQASVYNLNTKIYAPITAGNKGGLLVSNGAGAPVWINPYLFMSGKKFTSAADGISFTYNGKSYTIKAVNLSFMSDVYWTGMIYGNVVTISFSGLFHTMSGNGNKQLLTGIPKAMAQTRGSYNNNITGHPTNSVDADGSTYVENTGFHIQVLNNNILESYTFGAVTYMIAN